MRDLPTANANLFTPEYLLAEIEELRALAQRAGLGTMDYLLECAAIEARHQVEVQREARSSVGPAGEGWGPL